MKKTGFFITGLILVILFLSVLQVVVSNRLSTTGVELGRLQDEIKDYKNDNSIILEKLFTFSSLTYIADVAKAEGFVKNKSYVLVTSPLPLALKQ